MRINFLCNYVDGGWKPDDTRLGGTEESIVKWSEELKTRGHEITIYDNDTREGYAGGGDICVNIKSSEIPPKEPTLYFTNETDATSKDLSAYDGVIWPSNWAKDNIPVNNKNVYVVPHGYDPAQIYPSEKKSNLCLYASSPDRGLETLERIWPSVADRVPDAELVVTYGGRLNTPNTTCLGEVSEAKMNQLFRKADIWLHPANGGELFCISGVKAQVSHAIPVYFPIMALTETVQEGVPCLSERDMYSKLVDLMSDPQEKARLRKRLAKKHYVDWKESADILESIILKTIK